MDLFGLEIIDYLFIALAFLFVFEQIFYHFLGSYPYRHGILIKTLPVLVSHTSSWAKDRERSGRLAIKINELRNEIYIRYKYPILMVGPLLFIGQIQKNDGAKLKIRIGPLSAIFMSFLTILPLVQGEINRSMNSLALVAIIVWFYIRFLKNYKQVLNIM